MRVYIATALENASAAEHLSAMLGAFGIGTTYAWWAHGAVMDVGPCPEHGERCDAEPCRDRRIGLAATYEVGGVRDCDLLIGLLPGGRGTHTEIGIALGAGKPVLLAGRLDGGVDGGRVTAFYHAPGVVARVLPVADVPLTELALRVVAWLQAGNGTTYGDRDVLTRPPWALQPAQAVLPFDAAPTTYPRTYSATPDDSMTVVHAVEAATLRTPPTPDDFGGTDDGSHLTPRAARPACRAECDPPCSDCPDVGKRRLRTLGIKG
jgi:hypothetical protein